MVERLAAAEPAHWEPSLVERVSAQPVSSGLRGVPEKRTYGSDYPFRNVGQLDGLTADGDATTSSSRRRMGVSVTFGVPN